MPEDMTAQFRVCGWLRLLASLRRLELEDDAAADAAGLECPVRVGCLAGGHGAGHAQCELAGLGLAAELIEPGPLARVVAHPDGMEADAPLGRPAIPADGGDPAAVPHGGSGQLVQQRRVDEAVGAAGHRSADPGRVVVYDSLIVTLLN